MHQFSFFVFFLSFFLFAVLKGTVSVFSISHLLSGVDFSRALSSARCLNLCTMIISFELSLRRTVSTRKKDRLSGDFRDPEKHQSTSRGFWHAWKMGVYVMISVRAAGGVSACGKNLNVAIFSDTINTINVKLCMTIQLIEIYPFIPHSLTSIVFQGHISIKQFELKILCPYPIKLKLCMVGD